jgi:hypothetical protein
VQQCSKGLLASTLAQEPLSSGEFKRRHSTRHHRWSIPLGDKDEGRLPFFEILLGLRQLHKAIGSAPDRQNGGTTPSHSLRRRAIFFVSATGNHPQRIIGQRSLQRFRFIPPFVGLGQPKAGHSTLVVD